MKKLTSFPLLGYKKELCISKELILMILLWKMEIFLFQIDFQWYEERLEP